MEPRHEPQGALLDADGSVVWRVWAPKSERVLLAAGDGADRREIAMTAEPFGFHTHRANREFAKVFATLSS